MSAFSRTCFVLAWILASWIGACSKPVQLAPFHSLDLHADGSAWEGDRIVCLSATPESIPLRDHLRIVAESMPEAPMIPNADMPSIPDGCLELRFHRETPMSSLAGVTEICTELQIWRLSLAIEGRPAVPYRLPKDISAARCRPEAQFENTIGIGVGPEPEPIQHLSLERAWHLAWRDSKAGSEPVLVTRLANGSIELGQTLELLHTTWPGRDAELDLPTTTRMEHCLELVDLVRRCGFPAVRFSLGWIEF